MKRIKKWFGLVEQLSCVYKYKFLFFFFLFFLNKRSLVVGLGAGPPWWGYTTAPAAYCDCHLNISRPVEWVSSSSRGEKFTKNKKLILLLIYPPPLFFGGGGAYYYRRPLVVFYFIFLFHFFYLTALWPEKYNQDKKGERITSQSDIQWFHLNKTRSLQTDKTKQKQERERETLLIKNRLSRVFSLSIGPAVCLFVFFIFFSIKKCCQIPLFLWFFFGSQSHQSRIKRPHWPIWMDRAIHWRHWIFVGRNEKRTRSILFSLFYYFFNSESPFAFIHFSFKERMRGRLTGIAVMKSCLSYCCDGAYTRTNDENK